jgi:beta-galactosidase
MFQKIKALGFTGVSLYTNWAVLEGSPGDFKADGVFALEEFFNAAARAGIYLLARPGPYVNSELSGGGFPGWVTRLKGPIRTTAPD